MRTDDYRTEPYVTIDPFFPEFLLWRNVSFENCTLHFWTWGLYVLLLSIESDFKDVTSIYVIWLHGILQYDSGIFTICFVGMTYRLAVHEHVLSPPTPLSSQICSSIRIRNFDIYKNHIDGNLKRFLSCTFVFFTSHWWHSPCPPFKAVKWSFASLTRWYFCLFSFISVVIRTVIYWSKHLYPWSSKILEVLLRITLLNILFGYNHHEFEMIRSTCAQLILTFRSIVREFLMD